MSALDDRVQELMVSDGLSEDAARKRAQLELAVDTSRRTSQDAGRKPERGAKPTGRQKREARQLSEQERQRLAERFVWKPGDIKIIKRGRGK